MELQNKVLVKMDKMFFFLHISFTSFYTPTPWVIQKLNSNNVNNEIEKGHPNFHTPLPGPPHPLPQ